MAVLETSRINPPREGDKALRRIALAGNPNAGKTTLFNALTGLKQKVGNYPGVTVDKKEGRLALHGGDGVLLDLPGTYSLSPKSPDEVIARDVLLGLRSDTPPPDAIIVVVDASNLERNLFLATQILELGLPSVIALNMTDVARTHGKEINAADLSRALGAPVVEIIAVRGEGMQKLREALETALDQHLAPRPPALDLPAHLQAARERLADTLHSTNHLKTETARGIALRLLCSNPPLEAVKHRFGGAVAEELVSLRQSAATGPHCLSPAAANVLEAQARYAKLAGIESSVVNRAEATKAASFTDRVDAILTHRVWGLVCFALLTLLVFQAIYSWAAWPMDLIDNSVGWLGKLVETNMAAGPLRDLLVNGVISGVGAVVIFLPQILILFFFIGVLEDSGYMARAAFVMDRLMARAGLPGRAFIPLMSSFACAIPGIMAARTIGSRRDRMTTILIAPWMSCAARLPVYTLMIGAFIPNRQVFGFLSLRAVTMFSMYVLGVLGAMAAAMIFKGTLFKGKPAAFMIELPDYKVPAWRNTVFTMWQRGSQFLSNAGTMILAISIVLWFLLSYPKPPQNVTDSGARVSYSFAGRIGHAVEPVIAPLGFNWKIGIGLIGAMSAREVFVATLGTVYSVGEDADETSQPLHEQMHNDRWPDGRRVWTLPTVLSLLVYFVFAMQCVSTLAVVKRETDSWKWPLFMLVYMTGVAWILSFIVYQVTTAWGWK